jgi:MYXO-CTERM domain-containing protein
MLETMVGLHALSRSDADGLVRDLKLPAYRPVQPGARGCGTAAFMQLRRWLNKRGVRLNPDAPPSVGHVDSTTLPMRVFYIDSTQVALAQQALGYAEQTWNRQIVGRSYREPWTLGDPDPVQPGMDFYLAVSSDWSGLTVPLADLPTTPICDCSSRVYLEETMTGAFLASTIEHEFNHTTQAATDCAESISAWENFATAVEFIAYDDQYLARTIIGAFQDWPEYPLDYWTGAPTTGSAPDSYYQYGCALFPLFLKDRYGGGDPAFLKDVWESFKENGTMDTSGGGASCSNGNVPDWFQGIDALLAPRGSSMRQAFNEFTEWRAVVDAWDDGAHFADGRHYPPPKISANLTHFTTGGDLDAREYGTRYLEYLPAEGDPTNPLAVHVTADNAATWSGWILLWRGDQPVERIPIAFDSGAVGHAQTGSLDGVQRVLFVVSQLQDGSHSTDAMDYDNSRTFQYSISRLAEEDAGQPPGPDASEPGLDAAAPGMDAAAEPGADASVPADAAAAASAADAGTVLAGGGCSCGTAGAPTAFAALALTVLLVARRRRSA